MRFQQKRIFVGAYLDMFLRHHLLGCVARPGCDSPVPGSLCERVIIQYLLMRHELADLACRSVLRAWF